MSDDSENSDSSAGAAVDGPLPVEQYLNEGLPQWERVALRCPYEFSGLVPTPVRQYPVAFPYPWHPIGEEVMNVLLLRNGDKYSSFPFTIKIVPDKLGVRGWIADALRYDIWDVPIRVPGPRGHGEDVVYDHEHEDDPWKVISVVRGFAGRWPALGFCEAFQLIDLPLDIAETCDLPSQRREQCLQYLARHPGVADYFQVPAPAYVGSAAGLIDRGGGPALWAPRVF